MSDRPQVGPDIVGQELAETTYSYDDRDVMLYALGIGSTDIEFVFERNLKVIPTFAVVPAFPALTGIAGAVEINPVMILHGEQAIDLHQPIPIKATLKTKGTITAVYDKGKGALITIEAKTQTDGGDHLFTNTFGVFVRGAGGFGGERGPEAKNKAPDRAPDKTVDMTTAENQALIYRLSGDRNPLHVDPAFASMAGFDRPILHGLCSFGYVGRAVLSTYCDNDPARLSSLSARFSGVVYPGDTVTTEMWDEGDGKIVFQAKTQEGRTVISNAAAQIS